MNDILSAHVTHQRAAMADIERLGKERAADLLAALSRLPGVRECAVLSTCNRVELYTVTEDREATKRALEDLIDGLLPFDARSNLVLYLDGNESVRHILRVASGLESMVLGEDQVQGQVREAFELAEGAGCVGPVLSIVLRKAISVGKRVRSETGVNKGGVSIGSAAVELAESKLGSLRDRNILVIGAGEMATLIAKHLAGKGPRTVFVSNRTHAKAVELAWALGGRAVRFDSLVSCLARSDVVLCATAATHPVLGPEQVEAALGQRDGRLIVIDVSFPRNVDPAVASLPGVEYYDLDGLRGRAEENVLRRRAEVRSAERIIALELDALDERIREMRAEQLISSLYLKFNSLKEREVRKALNRLAAGHGTVDEVLEDFASSLTYKFLSEPTAALKEASKEGDLALLSAVGEMFKVEGANDVPDRAAPKSANESGH